LHSHPTWLVERWAKEFGESRTTALLNSDNRVPHLCGYLTDPQRKEETLTDLEQSGCQTRPGRLLREALILDGGNPSEGEIARRGGLAIQDEASQAIAHLVAVKPGNSVLDVCAAPGGKTMKLARDAGPSGRVIAADLHPHRVRAMQERFERAGINNIETLVLNAAETLPFDQKFDRILVDAPCSGTGTLSRHPEIRWRLLPNDLGDLHARQVQLLTKALPHLAPGGRLVYSTCSLEPEENERVVSESIAAVPDTYHIESARDAIAGILREGVWVENVVSTDGFFRTFPPEQETDGFFGAVIVRG
jgi:16S rRNA (cytosine967-C5)-methyltransferase